MNVYILLSMVHALFDFISYSLSDSNLVNEIQIVYKTMNGICMESS